MLGSCLIFLTFWKTLESYALNPWWHEKFLRWFFLQFVKNRSKNILWSKSLPSPFLFWKISTYSVPKLHMRNLVILAMQTGSWEGATARVPGIAQNLVLRFWKSVCLNWFIRQFPNSKHSLFLNNTLFIYWTYSQTT